MTANLIWSIALAAIGITGLWLAGSAKHAGWAVGLAAQVLWLVFGLVSGQYGFIASAVAYGIVYGRNWRRARCVTRVLNPKPQVRVTVDASNLQREIERARDAARRAGA